MKRAALLIITALVLFCCGPLRTDAKLHREILTASVGAGTGDTQTVTTVCGYIDEIDLDVVTAGTTGTVTVVIDPEVSTLANVTLVTSTNLNADKIYRPRIDVTDTTGAALTNDPPTKYGVIGGSIIFTVTGSSATGVTYKCLIKWTDE